MACNLHPLSMTPHSPLGSQGSAASFAGMGLLLNLASVDACRVWPLPVEPSSLSWLGREGGPSGCRVTVLPLQSIWMQTLCFCCRATCGRVPGSLGRGWGRVRDLSSARTKGQQVVPSECRDHRTPGSPRLDHEVHPWLAVARAQSHQSHHPDRPGAGPGASEAAAGCSDALAQSRSRFLSLRRPFPRSTAGA